jgi:hypothetical protein
VPDAAPFVTAVTFDAGNVYQCSSAGVSKLSLAATGAVPTPFFQAPTIAGGFECGAIVITANAAYLTHHDITGGKDTIYTLALPPASPNAVPTLIPNIGPRSSPLGSLTALGTRLFWTENDLSVNSLPPNLVTVPVSGGQPTVLDSDLGSNTGVAIAGDASSVYWTDTHGFVGQVRSAPLNSLVSTSIAVVAKELDTVYPRMALDSDYVYFMAESARIVFRAKKDGSGEQESLGSAFVSDDNGDHKGFAMTGVDASFVYFLLDDGLIARLPKVP